MSDITRNKFVKENDKQINLGVKVLVNAYNSKCKRMIDSIKRALKKEDVREAATLPRETSLVKHLKILTVAMKEKKRPEADSRGWEIVIQRAYDELTKNQVSVNDIKHEQGEKKVTVQDVCPQEDQMEKDAEQARAEMEQEAEQVKEQEPMDELPFPEEFDIWQSDAYSFLTAFCKYSPEGDGAVTMSLKAFEMLFRRQYGRRNIA